MQIEDDRAERTALLELEEPTRVIDWLAVSEGRIFYKSSSHQAQDPWKVTDLRVEAIAFRDDGTLEQLPSVAMEGDSAWYGAIYARGGRAFITNQGQVNVIDTRDSENPTLTVHDILGWSCSSLEVHESKAYCAMGLRGVYVVDLE